MLDSNFKESTGDGNDPANPAAPTDGETEDGIHLKNINAEILEVCIKFMHYKLINR